MENPIIMNSSNLDTHQKDISPFESEACENYLKEFQLNLEELVPAKPKDSNLVKDENVFSETKSTPKPNKIQSRRPTIEINGVQVKPKTLAEYRAAIKQNAERKSIECDSPAICDVNDENRSKPKGKKVKLRRHTTEVSSQDVKKLNNENLVNVSTRLHTEGPKKLKSEPIHKPIKPKEEAVVSSENTVTRSGRVSKKVLKDTDNQKNNKNKKQEHYDEEDAENLDEESQLVAPKKEPKKLEDHCSSKFLLPDCSVDLEKCDTNVIMYTGAGRHLHSYAIHNYNLLTENKFNISSWQRDFALTALSNNIDNSARTIYRSCVPLVSKKLIKIRENIKEGKYRPSSSDVKNTKYKKKKKKSAIIAKLKNNSVPNYGNTYDIRKKIKDDKGELDSEEVDSELSENKSGLDTSPEVKTLKRKLNPNEEDDLYWEMYGTHRRVKLKLIQTQSDSNKKPQWTTSVNYERGEKPEETEEKIKEVVSTVLTNMLLHVELNNEYSDMQFGLDPTYLEEKKEEDKTEQPPKTLKRKRNNSSRVRWELKKLDVLFFEHESETDKQGATSCSNDFCKLGCVCESISVKPKNMAKNHCSEIDCIFQCVCPAPKMNDNKPPIRDETEIIRSVAEKINGRSLAKKEKEWTQTLVKTNDEYIVIKNSASSKNKREVKKPERYREEWENIAHQKFLYEKLKRDLREKNKKVSKDETSQKSENEESSEISSKEKRRSELKLLKKLKKKKRLQELREQEENNSKDSDETKKTSPLKFTFCREHSVLDCKCKIRKEKEAEKDKDIAEKFNEINESINRLTSNVSNLTSDQKDQLLSLMREQQTLKSELESKNAKSQDKSDTSCDESSVVPSNDDEFMDLDKLSKFIPKPEGDSSIEPEDIDVEKCVKESLEKQQAASSTSNSQEDTTDSRLSDDIEMIVEEVQQPQLQQPPEKQPQQQQAQTEQSSNPPPLSDDSLNLVINSVRSIEPEEFEKNNDDDEIEVISAKINTVPPASTANQQCPSSFSNTIQNLSSQNQLSNLSSTGAKIDFYAFILHEGIGYLPISFYSPQNNQMIFKDPTKEESVPVLFHGNSFIEKASHWANLFLKPYIKFYPENLVPKWRVIRFSTIQELKEYKLFDFNFLRQYKPMIYTKDNIVYKNKNKTLFKLLLHPIEKKHKFKQVMSAKLEMDDINFINRYEFIHKSKTNLPSNVPFRFLQVKDIQNATNNNNTNANTNNNNNNTNTANSNIINDNKNNQLNINNNNNNDEKNNSLNINIIENNINIISPQKLNNQVQTKIITNNNKNKNIPKILSNDIINNNNNITSQQSKISPNKGGGSGIFIKSVENLLNKPPPSPSSNNNSCSNIIETNSNIQYNNNNQTIINKLQQQLQLQQQQQQQQSVRQNIKNTINKLAINRINQNEQQQLQLQILQQLQQQQMQQQQIQQQQIQQQQLNNINTNQISPTNSHILNALYNQYTASLNNIDNNNTNTNTSNNKTQGPRHNLPNLNSLLNKKPLGFNQPVIATSINKNINQINNSNNTNLNIIPNNFNKIDNNQKFIQLTDLISKSNEITNLNLINSNNKINEISNINKSYPILSKSLETPITTNNISEKNKQSPTSSATTGSSTTPSELIENDIEMNISTFKINKPLIKNNMNKQSINLINNVPNLNNIVPKNINNKPNGSGSGIKKPIPGLKAINQNNINKSIMNNIRMMAKTTSATTTGLTNKKLTDEVDIVANNSHSRNRQRHNSNSINNGELQITKLNTTEPECIVQEICRDPEISIVECLNRLETSGTNKFQPITFTPNGEDTVTISPISNNNNNGPTKLRTDSTVFEKLSAVKRINDGEPLDIVARSLSVSIETLKDWLRNFQKLQQRAGNRLLQGGLQFSNFSSGR